MREAVLVTGAGRRIGRALALTLGGDGYAVAVHYHRSRDEAESVAREIIANGWHDRDFVENATSGFEAYKEHVERYTLEYAERTTGVPAARVSVSCRTAPVALVVSRRLGSVCR